MRILISCKIALLLLAVCSYADTVRWISEAGGDFNSKSNWSGGAVPGANDIALFGWNPNATNAQTITDSASVSPIRSLTIQNGTFTFTNVNLSSAPAAC
jgi:hypothetical protein